MLIAALLALLVAAQDPPKGPPVPQHEDLIAIMRGGRLVLIRPDGTGERRASDQDLQYDRPLAWDASGARLFVWLDPGGWRVGAVDVATGGIVDLTPGQADCRMARASPDGRLVAFMQGGEGLCVMRTDGSNRRVVSKLGHRDAPPAWSPDSLRLAFTDLRPVGEDRVVLDVHVVAAEGGESRRVAASAEEPAWSADGRRVFVIARRGKQTDIVAVDVASGEESKVTDDDAVESELVPSPDRRRLAFVTDAGKKPALVVIDADGKNRRQMVALRGRPQPPTWSPDGKRLAFVSLPEDAAEGARDSLVLHTVDVERGKVTQMTTQPANWPAWRPSR